MSKLILIIDDSISIRQSARQILEEEGYEVIEAVDGMDGLSKFKSAEKVDCVVTDINMPNMNGIEFIFHARKLPGKQFVPILVLTTESQRDMLMRGKEAGATGWIMKPFNSEKLVAAIRKVLH